MPYAALGVTVTDNVDQKLKPVVTYTKDGSTVDKIDTSASGTYLVHYNVSDTAGNQAVEVIRTVIVTKQPDITKPVIVLKGEPTVIVDYASSYTDAGVTITDNVDQNLQPTITYTKDGIPLLGVNMGIPGVYIIHYNATDKAGNKADEVTRSVTVLFIGPPGPELPPFPPLPTKPIVTADDVNDVIIGANNTMEYSTTGGSDWVRYDVGNPPKFEGDQTVLVRYMQANNLPNLVATLVFRKGHAPVITGVQQGKYNNTDVTPSSAETDITSITLNGNPYQLGTPITTEDSYMLVATNASNLTTTIQFVIDKTPPNPPVLYRTFHGSGEIKAYGTAEPNAKVSVTLTMGENTVKRVTTASSIDGSFEAIFGIEGFGTVSAIITATQTDLAGNVSAPATSSN